MRSRELDLTKYNTDKIPNNYLEMYDPVLMPWVNEKIKLLEIGVAKGESLLLWRDYFPFGTIVGVDIKLPKTLISQERIQLFEGSQSDASFLSGVAGKIAPEGFDIIIDDASHIGDLTKKAFWHLFDNHLKPGGLYAIEDWGTGYWNMWPDGKCFKRRKTLLMLFLTSLISRFPALRRILPKMPLPCHSYGMVGFIKELVDEQGAADITKKYPSDKSQRKSKFANIIVTPSIVFVKKGVGHS